MTKNSKTALSTNVSPQPKHSDSDIQETELNKSSFGLASQDVITQTDSNPVNGNEKLDADKILTEDHQKVKKLFEDFESADDLKDKERLCKEICIQLIIHTKLEEELLYPECRAKNVETHLLDEAQVEHDSAKILIGELISLPANSAYYDAKVKVLSEYIKHHVGEEEKASDGIFAKARNAGVDMTALGMRLQLRKKELLAKEETSILRPPKPRSLETKFNFINPYFQENQIMTGRNDQNRDEYERFTDNGNRSSSENYSNERYSNDRYGNNQNHGRRSNSDYGDRDRDEYGRFMSNEDIRSRYQDYDDNYSSRSSGYRDDDRNRSSSNQGRSGQGHGGWFGDSEGHSEAARRGRHSSSRYGNDDYDDRDRSSNNQGRSGQGHGGWFGDSEGHSEAARRGRHSSSRYGNDDYDDRDRSSNNQGRSGQGHGGWFGDSEGHSEAARRGRHSSSRYGNDDYDDRDRSSNNQGRSGQGHGGWFGDSEGHSEAARRGWKNR